MGSEMCIRDRDRAVEKGRSQTPWPRSKHNNLPSTAVDVAPWPIDWDDADSFLVLAGYILATADRLDVPLRWGGSWGHGAERFNLHRTNFHDFGHFELALGA